MRSINEIKESIFNSKMEAALALLKCYEARAELDPGPDATNDVIRGRKYIEELNEKRRLEI